MDNDNSDAAFLICNMACIDLAKSVPAKFQTIMDSLPGDETVVLDAVLAIERGDYDRAAELDEQLARVSPERICYPYSLSARAAHRIRIGQRDGIPELGAEALAIADRALAIVPRPTTMMLRFEAAALCNNVDAALETATTIAIKTTTTIAMTSPAGQQEAAETFLQGDGVAILAKLEELKLSHESEREHLARVMKIYETDMGIVSAR